MEKPRDNRFLYGAIGAAAGFVTGPISGIVAGFMARGKEKDLAALEGHKPNHGFLSNPLVILGFSLLTGPLAGAVYGAQVGGKETKYDIALGNHMQQARYSQSAMQPYMGMQQAMATQQQMASTQWRDYVNNQRAQAALMQNQQR